MGALQYMRLDEQAVAQGSVVPEPLLGTWFNTNTATRGIAKAVLAGKENGIVLRIFAAGSQQMVDWGETAASIFAADALGTEAMAFSAVYEFGFMETQLQGHVRQGVLIIAKFDRFKDDSGRSNYFSKEFFYRTEA
jgi:hypothetical protein